MAETITLTIDGREITAEQGKTLLDIARELGADVPAICFHDATTANGLCRMCVVEVEGSRVLQPACVVQAGAGMKVKTRSEKVDRARKTILEMLNSTMDLSEADEIQGMMKDYGTDANRFPAAERRESEIKDDNPMYIPDYSKCLLCWRCVQVCAEDAQYTYAINFEAENGIAFCAILSSAPKPVLLAAELVKTGSVFQVLTAGFRLFRFEFSLNDLFEPGPRTYTVSSAGPLLVLSQLQAENVGRAVRDLPFGYVRVQAVTTTNQIGISDPYRFRR